jgi:hypothetical protein
MVIFALPSITDSGQGSTSTSIVLWVIAVIVVILGMPRVPLVPDRLWRFLCWSVAVVLVLYAAARIDLIPSGWIWITWAFAGILVLGLASWIERLLEQLEHRGTETAKENWRPSVPTTVGLLSAPTPATPSEPDLSREPIFDEAPAELADISPASLQELFEGRTELQKANLFAPHIGKEVHVSGQVESVETTAGFRMALIKHLASGFRLWLFFDHEDYDADPVLLVLNKGDNISLTGQIYKAADRSLSLDKCKDIEVRGPRA